MAQQQEQEQEIYNEFKLWCECTWPKFEFGKGDYDWTYLPVQPNVDEEHIRSLSCETNEHIVHIDFGKGTQRIEPETFRYQTYLGSIKFPETLESIGFQAFAWCDDLECVSLPRSVRNIESMAFHACYPYVTLKISQLENVGKFPFGFSHDHQDKKMSIIDCGFIQDEDEGNKFRYLNCYERICYRQIPLSERNHLTVGLIYPKGQPLNPEEYLYTADKKLNTNHSGFQATQPEVRICNWIELDIVITLSDLDGTKRTITGFIQQREGQEDFQALVNTQYPELAQEDWSIVLPWYDEPVKQLGCLELLLHCYHKDIDITQPILRVFDNPSEPEPVE